MTDTVTIPADVARDEATHLRYMADEFDRRDGGPSRNARALRDLADLLDPPAPTLREQVAAAVRDLGIEPHEDEGRVLATVALRYVMAAVEDITGPSVGDIVRSADVIYRADVLRLLGAER